MASVGFGAVLVKTLWGCEEVGERGRWAELLRRVKADGFDAVEVNASAVAVSDAEAWRSAVGAAGLRLVAQVHSSPYVPRAVEGAANTQGAVMDDTVEGHIATFRQVLAHAKACGAFHANVHGGHDRWDVDTAVVFLQQALAVAKEVDIPVSFETHRRRVLWNPWEVPEILGRVPQAQVTADLSHYVVVLERCPTTASDPAWKEVMSVIAERTVLVHARVGFNEGPQVPDPSDPMYAYELAAHEQWWQQIWASQKERGLTESLIEPEFGPPGYMHVQPHTGKRASDLWEVNTWVAYREAKAFAAAYGGSVRIRECTDTSPKPGFGDAPAASAAAGAAAAESTSELATFALGFSVIATALVGAFVLGRRSV